MRSADLVLREARTARTVQPAIVFIHLVFKTCTHTRPTTLILPSTSEEQGHSVLSSLSLAPHSRSSTLHTQIFAFNWKTHTNEAVRVGSTFFKFVCGEKEDTTSSRMLHRSKDRRNELQEVRQELNRREV
ncbi:hypothetical protein CEXT_60741 [Caerostris extrusa]|uniref:Uncharacterized protein n=1 Tax=Caerostris extrusa TaxID=172846 RepID=A0AAV4XAZ1_CAEEX|nr:hypothetical protein CEXT_60741 [Caerostris extrusa]